MNHILVLETFTVTATIIATPLKRHNVFFLCAEQHFLRAFINQGNKYV